MTCWWQDITTGEIFERPDAATCRREVLERIRSDPSHYVYLSRQRIPVGHGQWWRDLGCPPRPVLTHVAKPVEWGEDLPYEEPQAEVTWGVDEPEDGIWGA